MNSPALVDSVASAQLPPYCPAPPPQDMGTRQSAEWWGGLSAGEQQAYMLYQPASLGAMDGLPAQVRHEANLQALQTDAASGNDRHNAQQLLDRVEESWNDPDLESIYLLGYEPPGPGNSPDARVIASVGNPDTADNVAIYVPGTGTDLGNIGGSIDRMDDLRAQTGMIPGSGDTAGIVWLGYDAPDTIPRAIGAGYARDGAPDLRDFTEGLRESSQNPDARTTVIGHSYGSTVVGHADSGSGHSGLGVDEVIVMGSPGMGVGHVGQLHTDNGNFWAGAASNDAVTYTEVHGNSPVDWSFGGQRISTDGASGHSEYWEPGTESLRNQAYIVTGNHEQVDTVRRRFG